MEVILQADVPNVGRKGEIKRVSDGYASNFLLPRRLAEPATAKKVAALKRRAEERAQAQEEETARIRAHIRALDGQTIEVKVPANEKGNLYRKIDAAKLAQLASGIPSDTVYLKEPIKETGPHEVEIAVGDIRARVTIQVTPAA